MVSETIGANSGLGKMMPADAQAGFNVELVFAGVAALAVLGIALYAITALVERRFTGWPSVPKVSDDPLLTTPASVRQPRTAFSQTQAPFSGCCVVPTA